MMHVKIPCYYTSDSSRMHRRRSSDFKMEGCYFSKTIYWFFFYIFEIIKGAERFKLSEPPLDPPLIHFTTFQGIMFQIVDHKVRYILKGLTNN